MRISESALDLIEWLNRGYFPRFNWKEIKERAGNTLNVLYNFLGENILPQPYMECVRFQMMEDLNRWRERI